MEYITTSLFELFKIGPGPSSSHTIGPMKAANHFVKELRALEQQLTAQADAIEVRLFGSLSATGEGHGTRRAIVAGFLEQQPETCDPDILDSLELTSGEQYTLDLGANTIQFNGDAIVFDAVNHSYPFCNTMVFTLLQGKTVLFTREYYSIGGGSLRWQGWEKPRLKPPPYPYTNMEELKKHLVMHEMRLHQLILANEMAISGLTREEVDARLDRIISVMEQAVLRGIQTEGRLPGPIGLHRKAPTLYNQAKKAYFQGPGFLNALNAYAMAVAEENAVGHTIVTAPTAGASGVIPALLFVLKRHMAALDDEVRQGLMAAAAIGFLAKNNASISGAEVGCQGEVGVASAMGAAMMAYTRGYRFQITENAAETALEHHLGLTCDPVGGYVQIPCIERNAMGAVKAYNAYLIAASVDAAYHLVDLDKVMKAMAETGRDMSTKYKETSQGGLALSVITC